MRRASCKTVQKLKEALPGKRIYSISGAAHKGLDPLLESIWRRLQEIKEEEAMRKPSEAEGFAGPA